jgi:NADPH:quinone reductase-like Zn-dependent oxidoreductase
MKAIVGERYGPHDVLELREVDKPAVESVDVLVRVRASSVNPTEWYRVHGPFFMRPSEGHRRAQGREGRIGDRDQSASRPVGR